MQLCQFDDQIPNYRLPDAAIHRSSEQPCPRLRWRDGHDAVRQGRVHQQELRRAEPDAARARRRSAPGVRPRRRRHHRDQHLRRQPHQARVVRAGRQAARDQRRGGADRARAPRGERAYVAGSIGPLGIRIEPWGKTGVDEARDVLPRTGAGARSKAASTCSSSRRSAT